MSGLRWADDAPLELRSSADPVPSSPGEGRVVQDVHGGIVAADATALELLHHTWDTLTGVTSLDPRWHACGADGREVPGEEHPAMVALATGEPVRRFVLGVEAPSEDGEGTFVWLEVDSDPVRGAAGAVIGAVTRFRDVSDSPVGRRATQRVIHSYRDMAHKASAQEARFRAMVLGSSDIILQADRRGLLTWASPSVQDVLGWTPDELVGTRLLDAVHELDRGSAASRGQALLDEREQGGREELRMRTADGGLVWMNAVWQMMVGDDGEEFGVLVSLRDVHADVERREALAHMAHHDGLTGLLNRDSAYAWIRSELRRAQESGRHLAVMYLDVDFFKDVNDLHGHPTGDLVLAAVAQRLQAAVREDDMVARAGGDEFVVGLRFVPDEAAVERRADAILTSVRDMEVEQAGDVTVSIGLAVDDGSSDVDVLVQRADEALFRAKRAGRNRFSW